MQRHPEIEINVVDGTYESLTHQLRNADVDIIVGALRPGSPPEVEQEALFRDDLSVVARPGHPCLKAEAPTLAQLLEWPWVVPLPATPARAALERTFADEGLVPPGDHLQATSAQFTREIVARTDHLALASHGQAREDEHAGILRIVPVAMRGTTREIGIARRSGSDPSPDLQALVESLREQSARFRQ
jgi:DNA-binding transcriptional LysR family regulator